MLYRTVEDYPEGLPRLAKLLESNESFCMYRMFAPQVARILLIKEIELDQLQQRLHELDQADAANPAMEYRCKSIEHLKGWDSTQRDLLKQFEVKIDAYCKL